MAVAEITNPYTVDEKPRVSFADMVAVGGYEGLENYEYEYVGGYLHITFTYTHHGCCFSSFSPEIYITAEDPRTTATPTVRSSLKAFQLLSGTHDTDWYEYDIQFDATGYTVVVRQAGVTEKENRHDAVSGQTDTDYAALTNDYDIDPSSLFSMSFTPRLVHEAAASGGSGGGGDAVVGRRGEGDRQRCVETNIGLYCPSDLVRRFYIKEALEQMRGLMYLLSQELAK